MKDKTKSKKAESVDQYTHKNAERPNNPPVGLVTSQTDRDQPRKKYSYDPHMDPQLQWSGKQENKEFEIDTVSLHVHERIDPITILEKTMKQKQHSQQTMLNFFDAEENNPPLRDAIEFYKHDQNWSNRLIAGDSLLVMNSLLEKEEMKRKVQMIYIDPPYGIKYGSNFQPFINKRNVKDGKDEDLTQEPEMIKAFRDTWELGIHSYLSYLQSRLILAKELLTKSGSIFVQISDENLHHVREILDEVFGSGNFVRVISFRKTSSASSTVLPSISDYLIWYAKDIKQMKYRQLFQEKNHPINDPNFRFVEMLNGTRRYMTKKERSNPNILPSGSRIYRHGPITSQDKSNYDDSFEFEGEVFIPGSRQHWKTTLDGMARLVKKKRIEKFGSQLSYIRFFDDFSYTTLDNMWNDSSTGGFGDKKIYAVQTIQKIIQRCVLMTTDPSDLVFDPTCGSGTTAFVAEKWGRRWITCDTSRIAIAVTKQRLMTGYFDYFKLSKPSKGISSGFDYEKVSHITLDSIANNKKPSVEIIYDKPEIDKTKTRITGPFTTEAVPAPTVKSIDVLSEELKGNSTNGITIQYQQQWRDEVLKTGIRGKGNQKIEFSRVESHPATRWLHAKAETKEEQPRLVMISFGPEHAPLEQRQVELALGEAGTLIPKPTMVIFAAMQFDPEASKDIDMAKWPGVALLKAEMNKDLLTRDLKKNRSTNESFWLIGQPDVDLHKNKDGKYVITVNGFDYYNTDKDEIESGGSSKIAMWMLDTDYDGRSLYPQQVFFPMEGKNGGWNKLAKTLQAQINEDAISKYQGNKSIPFESGSRKRAAVKIIDDRGIESLKIIELE